MGPGKLITFHRGGKTGSVIATADVCPEKQGSSKIQYTEPESTIALEHLPRRMMVLPPKTSFTLDGKKYYWKGYTDLFEEKTDKLFCQYYPNTAESADPHTGSLLVSEGNDKKLDDMIIISAVVMQHRSEARKRAVCHLTFSSNIAGLCWIAGKSSVVLVAVF